MSKAAGGPRRGGNLSRAEWMLRRLDEEGVRLTGRRELFDVQADPWEQDSLLEMEPTRAAEMEARLDELIVDSGGRPPSLPE